MLPRLFLMVTWLLCTAAVAAGQDRIQVHWSVALPEGVRAERGFRMFEAGPAIDIEVRVLNDEDSRIPVVLEPGFFESLNIVLIEAISERVVARLQIWNDLGRCDGDPRCPIGARKTLVRFGQAAFRATLATASEQPLPDGQYVLRAHLMSARQHMRTLNDEPWPGRIEDRIEGLVQVRRPSGTADQKLLEDRELSALRSRGDYAAILRIYDRRLAATPGDLNALGGRGYALLQLRRFPEAATALEPLVDMVARSPAADSFAPGWLALAYYAMGQDAKGEALIRRFTEPSSVAEAITRVKAAAADLARRR